MSPSPEVGRITTDIPARGGDLPGVKAENVSLEDIARPLTAERDG